MEEPSRVICIVFIVGAFLSCFFTYATYSLTSGQHAVSAIELESPTAGEQILTQENGRTANDAASMVPSTTTISVKTAHANYLATVSKSRPLRVWTMSVHFGTKLEFTSVLRKLLDLPTAVVSISTKEISKAIGNNDHALRSPCPHPHVQRRRFFEIYSKRREIRQADILFHENFPGNTELLMPFNKTIFYCLSVNIESGRGNPIQIREWYMNIIRISKDPRSFIVANNRYIQRYLLYFTGVDTPLIPAVSMYVDARYDFSKTVYKDIAIIGGNRESWFLNDVRDQAIKILLRKGSRFQLKMLRDVLKVYQQSDLVKYACIVFMPYTMSTMSGFEAYNMGIPSFYPSIDYMVRLEGQDFATKHAGWRIYWIGLPILKGGPFIEKDCKLPNACANPNDLNITAEERKAWWRLADYYQWKNVIYYDSPEDLAEKLITTDFADVSKRILKEVDEMRAKANKDWRKILDRALNPMPPGGYEMPTDYYLAMQERWNITKSELDESEETEGPACDLYFDQIDHSAQRPGPKFV